jgi:tRNA-modifying protein YgfZ
MPTAQLPDRTVILVDGPDAEHFLQNIVTTDLDTLARGEAKPGALLTPQGKIMFDFVISRQGETGFALDCRADVADDFVRRLTLYKLRARVDISKQEQSVVLARWQDDSASSSIDSSASQTDPGWLADKRFPPEAGVLRGYDAGAADAAADDFAKLRVVHGIAESGPDFPLGDAFPHDVLLDQTGGVGFRKGCYVGQEVVSRMQHRGTARRRVMLVEAQDDLPPGGADIRADGRAIGTLGGTSGKRGLAIVRIDRVKDALEAGKEISAGDVPVTLSIPGWATYTLPQDQTGPGEA